MYDAVLWGVSELCVSGLIFVVVFVLISMSDLESDYINPVDMCNKVNNLVLPEYITQFVLTIVFLLTGNWIEFLLNLPLAIYHILGITKSKYYVDPTTIFNTLPEHKRKGLIKLGFYMICFFFYLYRLVYSLVNGFVAPPKGIIPNMGMNIL